MEGWNEQLVLEVNIRAERREKWGHPERIELPTRGRSGRQRPGGRAGREKKSGASLKQEEGGSWHLLFSHSPTGEGGSSAFSGGGGKGEIPGRGVIRGLPTLPLPLPSPWVNSKLGFLAFGQGQPGLRQPGGGPWGPQCRAPRPEEALPWLGTETESTRQEAGKCGHLL